MTETEIAYIAGLFDGEGCANVVPYKAKKNGAKYNRMCVRITNTHRGVLDFVRGKVGYGSIAIEHRRREPHHKPAFRWIVQNANAVRFLKMVRPYLIIKAKHVDQILAGPISGRTAA